SYRLLGRIDEWTARAQEAEALLQAFTPEDQNRLPWQHALADAHDALGDVLIARGSIDEAIAKLRLSLPIRERLVAGQPTDLKMRADLWRSTDKLSVALWVRGTREQRSESVDLLASVYEFVLKHAEAAAAAQPEAELARIRRAKQAFALAQV